MDLWKLLYALRICHLFVLSRQGVEKNSWRMNLVLFVVLWHFLSNDLHRSSEVVDSPVHNDW